jgi:hypothetical protein
VEEQHDAADTDAVGPAPIMSDPRSVAFRDRLIVSLAST